MAGSSQILAVKARTSVSFGWRLSGERIKRLIHFDINPSKYRSRATAMPTFTLIVASSSRKDIALSQHVARSARTALVKWVSSVTEEEAQQLYGVPSLAQLHHAVSEQRPSGSYRGLWTATIDCGGERLHVALVRTAIHVPGSSGTRLAHS